MNEEDIFVNSNVETPEEENLYLGFVRLIGQEIDDMYSYEMIFTEHPDTFWGEDFENKPCCLVNNLTPDEKYVDKLIKIKTTLLLDTVQDNCCFGFQDCVDGIVALAYENIDQYDEYPDEGRLILHFGERFCDVEKKLVAKKIFLF